MPSGLVTDTENRQSLQDICGVGPWCLTEGIASTVTVKKSLPSASLRRRETFVRSSTSLGLRSTWSSRWSHRHPLSSHGTSERFVRLGVKQLHRVSHPVGIVQVSVFQWLLFDPYLDFGRGGMVGLMGDLRGLREGFIVVFVASEKQQILKAQSFSGWLAP